MKAVTVFIISCLIAAPLNARLPKAQAENTRSAPAPVVTAITLPEGTMVKLRLMQELSSTMTRAGESVEFEVLKAIVVDDYIVIERGAIASGETVKIETGRRRGGPGVVTITICARRSRR